MTDIQIKRRVNRILSAAGWTRGVRNIQNSKRYELRIYGAGDHRMVAICPFYKQHLSIPRRAENAKQMQADLLASGIQSVSDSASYVYIEIESIK